MIKQNLLGEKVYKEFEKRITRDHFTESNEKQQLAQAAEVVENFPFVTAPFFYNGTLQKGKPITHFIHVFRPNFRAQDYAHANGKLHTMGVSTTVERALSSAEHSLENSRNLNILLKKKGKTAKEFIEGIKLSAYIESAYYARLGGVKMDRKESAKIDRALMRRTLRDESLFKTALKAAGVDINDPLALIQIADDIDLTEALSLFVKEDQYFTARKPMIKTFGEINSEESVKLEVTKSDDFKLELLDRIYKKHPDMFRKFIEGKVRHPEFV